MVTIHLLEVRHGICLGSFRVCSQFAAARQEKLLQNMMAEILQMTSQAQPLKVGVPLFPFSHAAVFPTTKTEDGKSPDLKAATHVAPLPTTTFEEDDGMNGGNTNVAGIWNGAGIPGRTSVSPTYQTGY